MKWLDKGTDKALREEVAIPMSRDERADLHYSAIRSWKKDRRFQLLLFLVHTPAVFIVFIMVYFMLPVTSWFGQYTALAQPVLVGITLLPIGLSFYAILRPRYRYHLRRLCRERGYEVCVKCGYWLRGLGDGVKQCPECGAEREPMQGAEAEQPQMDTDQQGS